MVQRQPGLVSRQDDGGDEAAKVDGDAALGGVSRSRKVGKRRGGRGDGDTAHDDRGADRGPVGIVFFLFRGEDWRKEGREKT